MSQNKFTTNNNPTLVAVSNADGETPVYLYADPITHGLVISATLNISGADGAMLDGVDSAIRATVFDLTSSNPQSVAIVDGSGVQITSFGGGTQYADGAARGTSTGTIVMGDDGTLIQAITAKTLNTQVVAADTGLVVNAVMHGLTTAGGGSYVDVKVNPSGALSVDASGSTLAANSGVDIGDVTINNAAGAAAVNIQDGGNSITVDGAVTTSGTVTEANSAAILTSTQLLDDTVATLGTTTYTEATTKANIIGAVRRDADTTLVDTTNEIAPLQVNAGGQLKTAVIASALPTGAATSALQTTQDTSINTLLKPANTLTGVTTVGTVTSLTQMNGVAISMNTGVRDAGTQRVTIATNDVVPITDNSGSLTVDAPVATPVFVRLSDGAAAISTLPVSIATNTPTLQSGSTTAVTQATAANLNATVVGTGTFAVQAAATLAAETTKVIGVTRTADGSGNLLTSTTNALDINLKTSSITLPVSLTSTTVTGTVTTKETRSTTNTTATVASSATVVTLIASNANRLGATIYNDSTAILYVKLGATASTSDFTVALSPLTSSIGGYFEVPFAYTGIITGIWASATGNARVGEIA